MNFLRAAKVAGVAGGVAAVAGYHSYHGYQRLNPARSVESGLDIKYDEPSNSKADEFRAVINPLLKQSASCESLVDARPESNCGETVEPASPTDPCLKKWDADWDKRDVKTTQKMDQLTLGEGANPEKPLKPTATRHVLLVRHGQYNMEAKDDLDRHLTEVGKQQAQITGERLKDTGIKFDRVVVSTMTRAQETANLICQSLPVLPHEDCSALREGAPWPPIPTSTNWKPERFEFYQDYPRIESAFRKYIHRADASQTEDSYDLIVCHGNVIRYFVCRALQFPREGWLRMSVGHCGLTWITIRPSGSVSLRELGGVQHLPPNIITR